MHFVVAGKAAESAVSLVYLSTQWLCEPAHADVAQVVAAMIEGQSAQDVASQFKRNGLKFDPHLTADVRADVKLPGPVPRALPLIVPDGNQFKVDEHGAHVLTSQLGKRLVVPQVLVGPMREGKSTLNNLVARHMLAAGRPLQPALFGTSGSVRSCTRGIHVYALPLSLLDPQAPPGALWLLADCEGFGENKAHGDKAGLYDTKLFAVAVLTCQLFVFNTKEKLDASMIDRVATWQQVVSSLEVSREPKPDLIFALRDFALNQDGEALDYYRQCLQAEGEGMTAQRVLQALFGEREVSWFASPGTFSPGEDISLKPWRKLAKPFQDNFHQYLEKLQRLARKAVHPQRSWNGAQYAARLHDVVSCLNTSELAPVALMSMAQSCAAADAVSLFVDFFEAGFLSFEGHGSRQEKQRNPKP